MTGAPEILIRECRGFDEFDACVRLEMEIWGYDVRETIPYRELVVIHRIGGQVLGAFDVGRSSNPDGDSEAMVGFAMSMPGVSQGQPYLHSHMLAVQPAYRNAGVGRKLKLAQRAEALERGIQKMEWTFDPLEIKNAYLNIVRLGAVVHSYTPNFYGVFSSRLQAGLPSDRLHAEWWMGSPRVQSVLNGEDPTAGYEIQETIVVPLAVQEWKHSPTTYALAEALQCRVRKQFLDAFARGLTVVGFERNSLQSESSSDTSNGVYQLAVWNRA
jgi:predicted GNAT superfamily acetyltransferase